MTNRINKIECHPPSGNTAAHFNAFYALLDRRRSRDLQTTVLSYATRLRWKSRALQVELGESAIAYVKAVVRILNQSGDADAKSMISSALLGSWVMMKTPNGPLQADLALLAAASVLKSMLADTVPDQGGE